MCSAVIFWHCVFWHHHFSASITCEAIPSRSQAAITQGALSRLPDTPDAASRLVDLFVSRVATTVGAICSLTNTDVQVDSDQKGTQTSKLTESHHVKSQFSCTVRGSWLIWSNIVCKNTPRRKESRKPFSIRLWLVHCLVDVNCTFVFICLFRAKILTFVTRTHWN